MAKLKVRHFSKNVLALKPDTDQPVTSSCKAITLIQSSREKSPIELRAHVKFDEINFDGVHVLVVAQKNGKIVSLGSCNAKLYSVAQGDSWAKTPIVEKALTESPDGWKASYLASELPDLFAEVTLYVEVLATRVKKKIRFSGYFNHLGALEFMYQNKNKISFLDLTKADE